jgi:ABC-type multidrug transport system fused ATPase/permease subunit
VALARAFFRSHTALILDEPSSNLDPEAEDRVFRSLAKLSEGKLTIFTSHRLSNVALADKVMVLDEGRVAEFGAPGELVKNKNRYAELFKYQRDKYITPD